MIQISTVRRLSLFVALLLSGGHLFYPRLPLLGVFIALTFLLPTSPFRKLNRNIWLPAIIAIFLILLELLRPQADIQQALIRAANFACAILLLNTYLTEGSSRFQDDIYAVTKLFPIQALLTVILGLLVPHLFVPVGDTTVRHLWFLFYSHSESSLGISLFRPDGFFWEPGIFQIYLNLNLFLSLWVFKKYWQSALTIVAILLTQSTTGAAILVTQLILYVSYQAAVRPTWRTVLGTVLSVPMLISIYLLTQANITSKTTGGARGSYFARSYDAQAGWRVAVDNPLIGVGFQVDKYLAASRTADVNLSEYSASTFDERIGNSNGLVTLLYSMGFPMGGLFILGLIFQSAIRSRLLVPMILIISLIGEPLTLSPLFLFFAFSGIGALFYRLLRPNGRRVRPMATAGAGSMPMARKPGAPPKRFRSQT